MLGLANEIGTIEPGKSADIIAVAGDPLTDVTVLKKVDFVMAQGDGDSIGCRIVIDGVVKDERQVNTMNAYTYCLDKSG